MLYLHFQIYSAYIHEYIREPLEILLDWFAYIHEYIKEPLERLLDWFVVKVIIDSFSEGSFSVIQ